MKNLIRPHGKINYVNAGSAISAGDLVDLGGIVGIAINDIAASTGTGPVAIGGIYELAKENGTAHAVGDLVYWDSGNECCTKTPGSNQHVGIVAKAAGSSVLLVEVDINVGCPPRTSSMSASEYFSDSVAADSDDDTAGYIDIDTGFGEAASGFMVQVTRSGVPSGADAVLSDTLGVIRVADGSTYKVTSGDVVKVFAWLD